jgi:hypothetical protein
VNGAGGVFNRSDPNSTTTHVTTQASTPVGATPVVNLYPSSTEGSFTVTATVDNTYPPVSATFNLTLAARSPKPTINPIIASQAGGPATSAAARTVARSKPAGLDPPMVKIDPNQNYPVQVNGTGFVSQAHGTTSFLQVPGHGAVQLDTVFVSSTELLVYVSGPQGDFNGVTADTTAQIYVNNAEGSPGAGDGGVSNPVPIKLVMPHPAPAGSTLNPLGTTSILVPYNAPVVTGASATNGGQPVTTPVTGSGAGLIGQDGAGLIGNDGAGIIGNDGASIISDKGYGIISDKGYGLIGNDGGGLISNDGASAPASAAKTSGTAQSSAPQSGTSSAPHRTAANTTTGNYIASTDANGVFLAAPVSSNGIVGTHTHTITLDGIAQPITYTFTNLDPNDGHPATITALSRASATAGDPAFDLTVTGTGFVSGSLIAFGGVELATTYLSATQLRATVPAALLNYTGTLAVYVVNPDPNGGASFPVSFTVAAGSGTPPLSLTALSPNSVATGSGPVTLVVTGTGFASGATVTFNGTDLATTFVSATRLTATVPAPFLTQAGTAQIAVRSTAGGVTSALPFTIGAVDPAPSVSPGQPGQSGASPAPAGRATGGAPSGGIPSPAPPPRP